MALFYSSDRYHAQKVDQGVNEWVNYPEVDPRMPGLFAARATIEPGQGHNFHYHPGREEIIYVLQGTIAQWIGQQRQVLNAGDCALVPADAIHASFNLGKDPAIIFVVLSGPQHETPLAEDMADQEPWSSLPTP